MRSSESEAQVWVLKGGVWFLSMALSANVQHIGHVQASLCSVTSVSETQMLIIFSKTLSYIPVNSLPQDKDVNMLPLFWERHHSGDPSRKCLIGFGKNCLV